MLKNTYWVGQIPRQALVVTVLGSRGNPINLSDYTDVRLRLLDSRNRPVSLDEGTYNLEGADRGRIVYSWPAESVFKVPGDHVVQVELSNEESRDFTSVATLQVRDFGRVDI